MAIALLWLEALLQVAPVVNFLRVFSVSRDGSQYLLMLGLVILQLVALMSLTVLIQSGRNWARITYSVYSLVQGPAGLWGLFIAWRIISTFDRIRSVVEFAVLLLALFLLFLPQSNAWFRMRKRSSATGHAPG